MERLAPHCTAAGNRRPPWSQTARRAGGCLAGPARQSVGAGTPPLHGLERAGLAPCDGHGEESLSLSDWRRKACCPVGPLAGPSAAAHVVHRLRQLAYSLWHCLASTTHGAYCALRATAIVQAIWQAQISLTAIGHFGIQEAAHRVNSRCMLSSPRINPNRSARHKTNGVQLMVEACRGLRISPDSSVPFCEPSPYQARKDCW